MAEEMQKIYVCPDHGNNCAEMMAMNNWNNNPFMYLIWLAFFGRNGFGMNGENSEVLSRLNNIQTQMTDNHANQLVMDALQGNNNAIQELAGNLNIGVASLSNAVGQLKGAIDLVGAQNGIASERVVNSVLLGNKDLMQQIATCCCENKQLVISQGYENQLATLNQTNVLQQNIQTQTADIKDAIKSLNDNVNTHFGNLEIRALQDKIASLQESRAELIGQISNDQQTARVAQMIAPIQAKLAEVEGRLPQTVTLPYSCATAVPTSLAYAYMNASPYNGSIWS